MLLPFEYTTKKYPCKQSLTCVLRVRRWRSDSLTVIKTPEGIDSNKIVKNAYSRYNLSIGIGLSQVRRPAQFGNGWGRRGNQVLHHVFY